MSNRAKRSGTALIDFTLVGLPALFITMSIIDVSISMWRITVSRTTSRYAGMHGAGCAAAANTCTVTIGTLVEIFNRNAQP